jgi:CRP-like cAMP-binding protein
VANANRLLWSFPPEIRDRLLHRMQTVRLEQHEVLQRPNTLIEYVYFPLDCLISITVTMRNGDTSDAGLVGSREMVGINAFMGGAESTQTTYVAQVPGAAIRIAAEPLVQEFNRSQPLRDVLLRYTQAYLAQLSQNVACNRQHRIEERLARWLLESRDRLQSDELELTHELLSQMLGVRRAGVSESLAALADQGLLHPGRGTVSILDQERLQGASCECYEVLRDEYDRLLGNRASPGMAKHEARLTKSE